MTKYLPLLLVVIGAVAYHVSQKLLSGRGKDPWIALTVCYFFAFVVSFVVSAPWKRSAEWLDAATSIGGIGLTLGVACVAIEFAYLVAYRSGWKMGLLFTQSSVACSTAIVLTGVIVFKESFTLTTVAGMALAVSGVALMHWR